MNGADVGKQAFAAVQRSFAQEAVRAFQFLVGEFGLEGPELGGNVLPVVAFAGSEVRYRIMLDADDKSVVTRVEADLEAIRLIAELDDLVYAAGLGARNDVRHSAHTQKSLRQALESQARYVRQLQPHLNADATIPLLRAAHARQWRIT